MNYHRITRTDCLSVATEKETQRLEYITDFGLLEHLAGRWCKKFGYRLGNYLGNGRWDATTSLK